jgi:selenocysteine lyase/cysteine desulfurase
MKRRDALKSAAALLGISFDRAIASSPPLPGSALFDRDPEAYWARIREQQFLLPDWRVYLNNGSLGAAPRPVVDAVCDYLIRGAGMVMDEYPRWGYETMDQHRAALADYVGCNKDDLALTHNATEAMSIVAGGLHLKAGDEVLMTDQEHPSGRSGWLMRAARDGITVREVKIPLPPQSPEQLTELMISSIGPRTRVLSFSGITTTTGLILPMVDICRAARAKGVITVVDGAHVHGQIPVRISEIGCDFFAGSPHKWMFAPPGCGFLYIRDEMQDRLWPAIVTGGWDDRTLKAARFMRVGTNNRALFEGLIAAIRFSREIGRERIYARIHQLARTVLERARELPYIEMLTPADDRLYGGLVTLHFKKDPAKLWALCHKKKIWVMPIERSRVSTHVHTRPSDLDLFFETVREALG